MEDHADDLRLAAACLAGDLQALATFERDHLAPAAAALRRSGYASALVDDAMQLVRYRLLVATPEREAKLAGYRGTGSLAGWLRITALRQARALLGPRVATLDSSHEGANPDRSIDGALTAHDHGPRVREILREAIAALDERPREALRLEVVEGLPHHEIAARYSVHRTTVVRWIEDARASIAASVRRELRDELDVGRDTANSILGAFAGLDVSIASAFVHPR